MLAQGPPKRHLALCPKEQKGNTGATGRVGPPLPSHRVTLSPFPVSLDGFARGMSASSKPRRMWVTSLWAGCVHTPGESGLGGIRRVRAVRAAHADLLSGVSTLPRGRGKCQSKRASPLILAVEVRVGRSSSHTGQAQLLASRAY